MTLPCLAWLVGVGDVVGIVFIVFLFVVLPVISSQWFARKRLSAIGAELEMKLDPKAESLRALGCERLWKFRDWDERRNLLHGTVGRVETVIVEVKRSRVELKPGANVLTELGDVIAADDPLARELDESEMFVCFRLPGRTFPPFYLVRAEGFRGLLKLWYHLPLSLAEEWKAAEKLVGPYALESDMPGWGRVELHDNPGFNSFFFLFVATKREEDKEELKKVFTREVQDFFMATRGERCWEVQGAGEWIGFHTAPTGGSRAAKPYRRMLEEARRVHEVFARAAG